MYSYDATVPLAQVERHMRELVQLHPGQAADAVLGHLEAGGFRMRARLALHACCALAVPSDAATAIAAACELLHNASLVHDDLQDRDAERRGRQAVWRSYGDEIAICAGDLLLSAAYASLVGAGQASAALTMAMHARISAVIHGQVADLALQGGDLACIETYRKVAAAKSGPLLILPLDLALRVSGRVDAIDLAESAGTLFAIGYQMADDLDDVEKDAISMGLNIVAVLTAQGNPQPSAVARGMAIDSYRRCAAVAAHLPLDSGALLAMQAEQRADVLAGALTPA